MYTAQETNKTTLWYPASKERLNTTPCTNTGRGIKLGTVWEWNHGHKSNRHTIPETCCGQQLHAGNYNESSEYHRSCRGLIQGSKRLLTRSQNVTRTLHIRSRFNLNVHTISRQLQQFATPWRDSPSLKHPLLLWVRAESWAGCWWSRRAPLCLPHEPLLSW